MSFLRIASGLVIHQLGAIHLQGQCALTNALLRQQHAFDIGMFDQPHLRLARIFARAGDRPALRTLFGVVQRGIVARQTERCCSHADGNARFVHHMEHAFEAFAGFANQVTHCASFAIGFEFALTEIQQGIWRARPTQFVVQACKRHIVALPG